MIDPHYWDLEKGIFRVDSEPNDEGGHYFELGPSGIYASADVTPCEEDEKTLILNGLHVATTIRKQGIGRRLFDHITKHALASNFNRIESAVNNEWLAKIINASFPVPRISTYTYDQSRAIPLGEPIEVAHAYDMLLEHRSKMPPNSRPDDMLEESVYYHIDLR